MPDQTVAATAVSGGRLLHSSAQVEFDFKTEDGTARVSLPTSELMRLISFAGQMNRQPAPKHGEFVEIRAFAAGGFHLSGTEAGDYLLTLRTGDGAEFGFLFDRALAGQLHEVLASAVAS
jgi:hypothetical protein